MKMTHALWRMTNEAQSTKSKQLVQGAGRHSDFEIRILFVIRHPSFGFQIA